LPTKPLLRSLAGTLCLISIKIMKKIVFCISIAFLLISCSEYNKDVEPYADMDSDLRAWLDESKKKDKAVDKADAEENFENWDTIMYDAASKETQLLYMHWKIEKYQDKYNFRDIKDPSILEPKVYKVYSQWDEQRQFVLKYNEETTQYNEISDGYLFWYLSIFIGFLFIRLIAYYKSIQKKWLKPIVIFILITFLWLGTSCYSYLFLYKYNLMFSFDESYELSFLTLSTQLRFFSYMIMWLLNSSFILFLIILTHRMLANLGFFVVELFQNGFGYSDKQNVAPLKDKIVINLTTYVVICSILFYFYLFDNPIMDYFLSERQHVSINFIHSEFTFPILFKTFLLISITLISISSGFLLYLDNLLTKTERERERDEMVNNDKQQKEIYEMLERLNDLSSKKEEN
jgi:hypothetical protein